MRRSWEQQHAVSAGLGWESHDWEWSLAGAWRSGWPTTALEVRVIDGEYIVHADAMNTLRMQPYLDIDARVARKFQLEGGGSLTAFSRSATSLNRRNVCCNEYELERRRAMNRNSRSKAFVRCPSCHRSA